MSGGGLFSRLPADMCIVVLNLFCTTGVVLIITLAGGAPIRVDRLPQFRALKAASELM